MKLIKLTYSQQIIVIDQASVQVKFGYRKHHKQAEFSRQTLNVYYSETENNWDLPKIALSDGLRKFLIGEFLNLEDRLILKDSLEQAGLIICRNRWW
jgi:hypothetical protein